jgi:crossover junction endodeoxyribonuclease RuvC
MTMIVIGIDLGLSGALSKLMDGNLKEMADMPVMQRGTKSASVKNQVNAAELATLLGEWTRGHDRRIECRVVMERVQAMGGSKNGRSQGVSSSFSLGHTAGIVEGVVSAMGIPHEIIPPAAWKKLFALGADKDQARALAQRWYPAASLGRKKDHNRAESLLIARYAHEMAA